MEKEVDISDELLAEQSTINSLIDPAADTISDYKEVVRGHEGILASPCLFAYVWNQCTSIPEEAVANGTVCFCLDNGSVESFLGLSNRLVLAFDEIECSQDEEATSDKFSISSH